MKYYIWFSDYKTCPLCVSASDTVSMPDTLGHSVGIERYELLAKLAGNEVILPTV